MEGNREISKPSDKTEMSSVSRRSEKTIDFAAGHNLRRKEKEHKIQSEVSQSKIIEDHFTYKTSLEISRSNIDTKSLGIRDPYKREINALKITLLGHTEGIKILKNKINETQQKIKKLGDKKYFSLIDIYGYKGLYVYLEKDYNFIKKEITRLEEKHYASSKKSEALEAEVNGLNSKIIYKEQKQKELTLQFDKLTTEHNKTQEEYASIRKEIGTQVDSPSKNLNDLQEEIENKRNLKKNLQLEIEKSKKEISRKKAEKNAIKAKLGEIKTLSQYSQEMRERERDIAKLEKMVSYKSELIKKLKSQKKQIKNEIEAFIETKQRTESLVNDLKKLKKRYKKNIEERKFKRDHSQDKLEKHNLSYTIEFDELAKNFVNDRIRNNGYNVSAADKNIQILKNKFTRIENFQKEEENYERLYLEQKKGLEKLLQKNTNIHHKSTFDYSKNNELVAFNDQLDIIMKYSKNNKNIENLTNELVQLNDQHQNLQANKDKFEKQEEDHYKEKQDIEMDLLNHKLYLDGRESTIIKYKLKFEGFQTSESSESYNEQNLGLMQEKREEISQKIIEFDNRCEIKKKEIDDLKKDNGRLKRLISRLDSKNVCGEHENKLLSKYSERMQENDEKIYRLGEDLLHLKDEKENYKLKLTSIKEKICDHLSKEIESYRSELESFHTKKSELQTKIDAELTKIAHQFETDLQNLQQACDEKTLRLESIQSELKALEKSRKQEIKRQELQGQLKKLDSQVNSTHHEIETMTQELKGHRKELEESHKTLTAAEQEKSQLETQIEYAKKKLEETEKKIQSAGGEYKKSISAYKEICSSFEEAILKKDQQKADLAKAEAEKKVLEEEHKKAQKEFRNPKDLMKNQLQLDEKGPFAKDESVRKALEALEQAQEEFKKARTKLLNARRDVTDAVITMATPDDEDRTRMIEGKYAAIQRRDWRPPRPERS